MAINKDIRKNLQAGRQTLLVGEPTAAGLVFRGRVGSGIAGAKQRELAELLAPLVVTAAPFHAAVPRADAVGAVWVRPQLVIDVESLGGAAASDAESGRLRQPTFRGVRFDLSPADLLASDRLLEGGGTELRGGGDE